MTPNRYFNASVVGDNVTNVYMAYESPQDEAFFGLAALETSAVDACS